MDHATATVLVSAIVELNERLNTVASLIETVPDVEFRKRLRRPLGTMMADTYADLLLPIIERFPDLDPDKG